jgi:hypothetical protein
MQERQRRWDEAQEQVREASQRLIHLVNEIMAPRYGLPKDKHWMAEERLDGTVWIVEYREPPKQATAPVQLVAESVPDEEPDEELPFDEPPETEDEVEPDEETGVAAAEQEAEAGAEENHSPIEWEGGGLPAR